MIGPVRRTAKQPRQMVDGRTVGDSDGQHQPLEMSPGPLGKVTFRRPEESLDFSRHLADGSHAAAPSTTLAGHKRYRQN